MIETGERARILRGVCLALLIGLSLVGLVAGGIVVAVNNAATIEAARDGWTDTNAASLIVLGTWWQVGGALIGVVLLFFGAFARPSTPPKR